MKNNFFVYVYSTLWVRAITSAMEECATLEKSIAAEKALFSIASKI